ncbi:MULTISPECIES: hypothetical protein [Oceanobacillus]|nr:hypothetical protein [Oceanobacillus oncorhynchi]UUI39972.1 hypothetical protein NP440_22065 [Oceanobacillus oncorhynchi]
MYIENKEWDMLLLDLMLPGMAGEQVLTMEGHAVERSKACLLLL